jgi:large subunit ribosomal protein L18
MKLMGRHKRHKRIRKSVIGTSKRPRLCVFRSNRHIYAQIVDDTRGKVLFGYSTQNDDNIMKMKKMAAALEVGKGLARLALEKGITDVAFDRGGYRYHGRVKALADGARKAGLKF